MDEDENRENIPFAFFHQVAAEILHCNSICAAADDDDEIVAMKCQGGLLWLLLLLMLLLMRSE